MKNLLCLAVMLSAVFKVTAQNPVWETKEITVLPDTSQAVDVASFGTQFAVAAQTGIAVYRSDTDTWSKITDSTFRYSPSRGVSSDIAYDASGKLWVASGKANTGLQQYDGVKMRRFDVGDGLDTARLFRQIAFNPKTGEMWLAATVVIHLYIWSPGYPPIWKVKQYDELFRFDGLTFNRVWQVEDIVHFMGGVAVSMDGQYVWTILPMDEKLLCHSAITGQFIAEYPIDWKYPDSVPPSARIISSMEWNSELISCTDNTLWFISMLCNLCGNVQWDAKSLRQYSRILSSFMAPRHLTTDRVRGIGLIPPSDFAPLMP